MERGREERGRETGIGRERERERERKRSKFLLSTCTSMAALHTDCCYVYIHIIYVRTHSNFIIMLKLHTPQKEREWYNSDMREGELKKL